jgi:hypothetical protein
MFLSSSRCFLFLTLFGSSLSQTIIQYPRHSDRGSWGYFEDCPMGQFVTGMQLKTEPDQGVISDDTATNGLMLYCNQPAFQTGNTTNSKGTSITSSVHKYGKWGSTFSCKSKFGLVTGFNVRFENYQGWFDDDTGVNNICMSCNQGVPCIQGDGTAFGEWTYTQMCPQQMA